MGGLYDILQSYRDKQNRLNYEGLYQDPDRFLDYDNSRKDNSPMGNDYPFTGNIPTNRLARIDAIHYNRENLSSLPNNPYGVRSDYFDNFNPRIGLESQIPQNLEFLNNQNQATGIMQQAPTQNFEFLSSAYEDENEDDEQVDYLPGQSSFKDKISNIGSSFMQKSGIGGLLGLITGNPILGLIGKGIGALANRAGPALNDFKSASTGAQFFQNLRDRRAREDAAARGAAKQAAAARIESFRNFDRSYGGGAGGGGGGGAPSNTNSGGGTFGTSSNNSSFSDYS
jgi:hypothetical protein